jgi:hypothetical protein
MSIKRIYLLMIVSFILSCNYDKVESQEKENVDNNEEFNLKKEITSGKFDLLNYSSFDGITDSIEKLEKDIDFYIDKTITDLKSLRVNSVAKDSVIIYLTDYRRNYRSGIESSSNAIFVAVGLNHQNYNHRYKFQYYSLLIELSKVQTILKNICTTFFESADYSDTSSVKRPDCIFMY